MGIARCAIYESNLPDIDQKIFLSNKDDSTNDEKELDSELENYLLFIDLSAVHEFEHALDK